MNKTRFPEIIRELYRLIDELEQMFPGRHFTPDGHLVGSIGEALASYHYDITLFPASSKGHDGKKGRRLVQIKATQGKTIALRGEPQHLLVLQLGRDGNFYEIYNGPGGQVWAEVRHKPLPSNGQYQVSFSKLKELMRKVPESERLPKIY